MNIKNQSFFLSALRKPPQAVAVIHGSEKYSYIRGIVKFYQTVYGILIAVEIHGLPKASLPCDSPVFGFHIHEGNHCTGTPKDPFADAQAHFNPDNCPHPYHAGDLPPLFGCNGSAWSAFVTDRITVNEIVGKTVILHAHPDDFMTQPSGNSGEKIACGEIKAVYRRQGRA